MCLVPLGGLELELQIIGNNNCVNLRERVSEQGEIHSRGWGEERKGEWCKYIMISKT